MRYVGRLSVHKPFHPLQPSGHYMYRTVVTICTASWTFNNPTFCPHSVFTCFVWISEQTTTISLYNINWLVFITETECVYCAVWTESSTITEVNPSLRVNHWQYFLLFNSRLVGFWSGYLGSVAMSADRYGCVVWSSTTREQSWVVHTLVPYTPPTRILKDENPPPTILTCYLVHVTHFVTVTLQYKKSVLTFHVPQS